MAESTNKVAVLGATGYAGALAADILWRHPQLELTAVTGRSEVGERLSGIHPRYDVPLKIEEPDLDAVAARAGSALVAYPHKAAAPTVAALIERGLKVVDLSADFRLPQAVYEEYYQPHEVPQLLDQAVYGLTERHRERIKDADLVANPGCNSTAALLALYPVFDLTDDVIVDIKAGVSGAGRGANDKTHFVSVVENVSPYSVGRHRHRAELEMELGGLKRISFATHLIPLDQGILATVYLQPEEPITQERLFTRFTEFYAADPFVKVVRNAPGVRDVRDSNFAAIHPAVEQDTGRVIIYSAIDNLWKGAAGAAVQNLNLMVGLGEGAGLLTGQEVGDVYA
ncbi:MAG: N-acetyl-gamma-glutamyl-phosphate reductase [Solirubrobacterales bacterium]|nr:N-acetyl-gamma-glutamyl-phosphate reductase [Solirubrobacterales bacterium]